VAEILEGFADLYGDAVNFFLVDVTRNACQEDFGLSSFPALVYFRESMELDRQEFIPTPQMVEQAIKRILRL